QLVAILHSFVGLAAVLVGLSNHFIHWDSIPHFDPNKSVVSGSALEQDSSEIKGSHVEPINAIHKIEIFLGILIGGYTFAGSVIAFGKLDGRIDSAPLMIPHRHWINIGMGIFCFLLLIGYINSGPGLGTLPLVLVTMVSCVLGWHMIMAIGGADMPVVVSMLNSYSGWAAAAIGFLIPNDLLIVTGALVGSSGAILSYIMCAAMNRSFASVILGGFGQGTESAAKSEDGIQREYYTTTAEEVANWLVESDEVVIVPGYGMAVAQAQHSVREICESLKQKGVQTRFAIHPVAGRLPGHMNVLLAEAKVPYDIVLEMDEINDDFATTSTVLVIGANDIVNPGALDDESSPIFGMPVLECWHADHTVVLKRSMGTGYSGVDNPLFYMENSAMLFGDAKSSVDAILQGIREA
ncbi:MAG: NAD(P)(+) transhydrogenase (Re/Si-specific) subunit beta, partial [Planctomycetota bacterium]